MNIVLRWAWLWHVGKSKESCYMAVYHYCVTGNILGVLANMVFENILWDVKRYCI